MVQSGLCFPAPRGSRGVASVWLSQWWGQHFSQDRVVLRAFDPLGACEALSYMRVPVRLTPLAGPQVRKQGERAGDSPQRPQGRAVSGSQLRIPEAARGSHRGCPLPPKKRPNSAFSCHQPLGLQLPKPPPPRRLCPEPQPEPPGPLLSPFLPSPSSFSPRLLLSLHAVRRGVCVRVRPWGALSPVLVRVSPPHSAAACRCSPDRNPL